MFKKPLLGPDGKPLFLASVSARDPRPVSSRGAKGGPSNGCEPLPPMPSGGVVVKIQVRCLQS